MIVRTSILLAFAISVAGPIAMAAEGEFVARGNEPGWIVRKGADGLTFQSMGAEPVAVSPLPAPETVEVYRSTVDGKPFVLTIANTLCVDTMSGMPHPSTVTVEIGDQRLNGCGGEPATLLHGDWSVTAIGGKPILDGSEVTLTFNDDGMLSGGASCNRYFGGFALTGEGLTITSPGASMMMCDAPLMEQERLYLDILTATTGFEIGPGGSLVLSAGDGRTITATRKG